MDGRRGWDIGEAGRRRRWGVVFRLEQPHRHHPGSGLLVDLRLHGGRPGRRCSHRRWPAWTGSACASGTTAIAGWARKRYITRTMCCCCCAAASLPPTGSRPGRRRSWWTRCSSAGSPSVSLDRTVSTEDLLSRFDVEHIGTEALLFQTGYLTIKGEEELGGKALYRLGYPNREVRQSLNEYLLRHLVQDSEQQTANSIRLQRLLEEHDCGGLKELFHAFFASIPYQWYTNNAIADYEGFYASVVYSYFAALGLRGRSGGIEQPRAAGPGGAPPAATCTCSSSRSWRWRAAGGCAGAVAGARVRGQVPGRWRADPPDRGGVQPRDAQRDGVRGGGRLSAGSPTTSRASSLVSSAVM